MFSANKQSLIRSNAWQTNRNWRVHAQPFLNARIEICHMLQRSHINIRVFLKSRTNFLYNNLHLLRRPQEVIEQTTQRSRSRLSTRHHENLRIGIHLHPTKPEVLLLAHDNTPDIRFMHIVAIDPSVHTFLRSLVMFDTLLLQFLRDKPLDNDRRPRGVARQSAQRVRLDTDEHSRHPTAIPSPSQQIQRVTEC